MVKTLLLIGATAALTPPALAANNVPASSETLVHEGITYVYSVEQRGDTKFITGEDTTNRRPFKLRIVRGRVDGVVDGVSVSFLARDAVRIGARPTDTLVAAR